MSTLKQYTNEAHAIAESTLLMDSMLRGDVLELHWAHLLAQKQAIAEAIDAKLNLPSNVAMGNLIATDNTYNYDVLPSTQAYVDLINQDTAENVLADLYVNYLGDMYGGRYLANSIPFDNKTHLQIDNVSERVTYIRELIEGKDDILKDRAITAFTMVTAIYNDIFPRP